MKKLYTREEVEKIVNSAFFFMSDNGIEMTGKEYMSTFFPYKIKITEDEKEFVQKMEWYITNLTLRESIEMCQNEIETVGKNINKREKYISLMNSNENKDLTTKEFFDTIEVVKNPKLMQVLEVHKEKHKFINGIKKDLSKNKPSKSVKDDIIFKVCEDLRNTDWYQKGMFCDLGDPNLIITAWWIKDKYMVDQHVTEIFDQLEKLDLDEIQEGIMLYYGDDTAAEMVAKLKELGFNAIIE